MISPRLRPTQQRAFTLLFALLALVGSQASFALVAFPLAPHRTSDAWQAGSAAQSVVDAARLPTRAGRRGAVTTGPSDPSRLALTDWVTIRQLAARGHSAQLPESFVPPPPFHPPRGR